MPRTRTVTLAVVSAMFMLLAVLAGPAQAQTKARTDPHGDVAGSTSGYNASIDIYRWKATFATVNDTRVLAVTVHLRNVLPAKKVLQRYTMLWRIGKTTHVARIGNWGQRECTHTCTATLDTKNDVVHIYVWDPQHAAQTELRGLSLTATTPGGKWNEASIRSSDLGGEIGRLRKD